MLPDPDGRMEKFWGTDPEDRIGVVSGIFEKMVLTKQRLSNSLIRSQASQLTLVLYVHGSTTSKFASLLIRSVSTKYPSSW